MVPEDRSSRRVRCNTQALPNLKLRLDVTTGLSPAQPQAHNGSARVKIETVRFGQAVTVTVTVTRHGHRAR
jgi:hypothetical protein